MIDIKVYINNKEIALASVIDIADTDEVQLEIISTKDDGFYSTDVDILLEDYKVPYIKSDDNLSIQSHVNNLFRESFGYSNLRFFIDSEPVGELIFNVSTAEYKFKQIKAMMSYLLENNSRILDLCFSRTKYKSANDGEDKASFDSVISLAEKIVYNFVEKGIGLKGYLRHRLELIKEEANGHNFYNINPYDVIDNLDQLREGYSPDSITLMGKVYSMEAINRESHINSFDLEENKVLLGGLVSIKEELLGILDVINTETDQLTYDQEYTSIKPFNTTKKYVIEDLYTQLTTIGMEKRINSIIEHIDELLYFFQKNIQVKLEGFHPPKLSPFARKSSFYLTVYRQLDEWYSLGSPNIGIDHNLTKIRSASKIYELFTLYMIIDTLHIRGWDIINSIKHETFKNFIPSQVDLRKDNIVLNVFYERKISGFTKETQHNELIALNKNNPRSKYNYYHPDYIIVKNHENNVSYFILDAKYSSSNTLRKYGELDNLYRKYFSNFAVYNKFNNTLDKQAIKSVNAIHPFGDHRLKKWPPSLPRIIPNISTILLSKDKNGLDEILDLINEVTRL